MMPKPNIPQARITELMDMARGLYGTIMGLTKNPAEGVTLVAMMHLIIWLNNKDSSTTVEDMLEDYCLNFKENCASNEALHSKELN